MAVALNSGATKAYVANYGSGTLSEVDLSSLTVSRTATIGTASQSVAMDPSGSAVWVGGANYLKKVDTGTFAVTATVPVVGAVTSIAASKGQNELAYTLVNGCCSGASSYAANEMRVSDFSNQGNHASSTASPYAAYTMNGTLPTPAVIPSATQVSAQFGNAFAASATPTGFVIYELVGHQVIMTGTTATPVRGIASDPNNWVAYFAVPDSNQLISVPLPH
jgi:DNA-binding beta-propeller fold protein YncE